MKEQANIIDVNSIQELWGATDIPEGTRVRYVFDPDENERQIVLTLERGKGEGSTLGAIFSVDFFESEI